VIVVRNPNPQPADYQINTLNCEAATDASVNGCLLIQNAKSKT